ncbi:MAG: CvpA family protein [Armatimonadota bacterium]|nr:CvpA family protein [bacterium]
MNWVDAVIILIFIVYGIVGWRRGFIAGIIDLIGIAIALIVALLSYRYIAPVFDGSPGQSSLANVFAFVLVFFIVEIVFSILASYAYRRLPRAVHASTANRMLGLIIGLGKGYVLAAVLALISVNLPIGALHEAVTKSALGSYMLSAGSTIDRTVSSVIPGDIKRDFTLITIKPESGKTLKIPPQKTGLKVDPAAEEAMLKLINKERTSRGIRPLAMDPKLRKIAREHSRDMFVRGYFAHITPDGESPFDRMRKAHIDYTIAGENLAMAPTLDIAHKGLLQSPGHRRNILDPAFGRVGIGVYTSKTGDMMFTQDFAN